MGSAISLRDDFDGTALRRLARASKSANQARRLLALAAIYDGGSRSAAARLSDATVIDLWPNPEPLPSGLQPVTPFDPRLLPDVFQTWAMDIADRMQCPPDMVATTAMVGAGAVVGRKVGIRPQERTDWTE